MKKFFVKLGLKIVSYVLLLGIVFFSLTSIVYAKVLTINEINEEYKKIFIDEINSIGGNLSSSIDTTNKTLDVYSDSTKIASYKYTDEYIEYENRSGDIKTT